MQRVRGALFSITAITVVTACVYALRPVAPVLSLGGLYLFAVLPVSVLFGLAYAIPVAVASQLVFNFLFLPPLHTLALRDTENWVALAVYLVTAVVVSQLAAALVAAERVRRSDAIKTAVLRAVSHDLRSPLTAIGVASEGLASGTLDPEERQALLETVRAETRRLDRVVANLLDLSRLEVGAAAPHRELWTADMLVARALEQLGADAARVAVVLPVEAPPVLVDAAQIDRVIVNLLENALKFTAEPWAVELAVSAEGDKVVFRVVDHGPGVAEADRERIFEPFERAETARTGERARPRDRTRLRRGERQPSLGRADAGGGASFALALPAVTDGTCRRERAFSSSTTSPRSCGRCRQSCAAPATRSDRGDDRRRRAQRGGHATPGGGDPRPRPPRPQRHGRLPGAAHVERACRSSSSRRSATRGEGRGARRGRRRLRHEAVRDRGAARAAARAPAPRSAADGAGRSRSASLTVDLDRRSVAVDGAPVQMTPTEFRCSALRPQRGKLLTHSTILREVWGRTARGALSARLRLAAAAQARARPGAAAGTC